MLHDTAWKQTKKSKFLLYSVVFLMFMPILLLWWLNSSLIYSLPCMSLKCARWIPKMWSSYSPASQPHLLISSPSHYFGRNVAAPREHCLLDHLHKGYFISFIQTGRIIILLFQYLYFKMLTFYFLTKKERKKSLPAWYNNQRYQALFLLIYRLLSLVP